jgi:DNA-binding response OmpR family regulator
MRILLVEDNPRLSEAIAESLGRAGFKVDPVAEGDEALSVTLHQQYDAVVLDLGLPDMDGLEVLKTLRTQKNAVPVLVLTARDALSDKIAGLNQGADDYMVKPFAPEELVARIQALLRRPAQALSPVITLNNLSFDTVSRQAKIGDAMIELSRRETDLLEQLIRSSDKIVTKKVIEMRLYSYEERGSVNSVEVLVHRLRKKLLGHAAEIEIHTLRGIGYMLTGLQDAKPVQ